MNKTKEISKTKDIENKVVLGLIDSSKNHKHQIIAAGPITKQPGTMPFRVVMVDWEGSFSVHNEIFTENKAIQRDNLMELCLDLNSSLSDGSYFQPDEMHKAQEEFGDRLVRQSNYVESIYRN